MDNFFNFPINNPVKVIIAPQIAPPPPKSIDELSPVFRKVLNDVYGEFKLRYPHLFGTSDENNNNNEELEIPLMFKDESLTSIELTIDKSRRSKKRIQNAEDNYWKIVGKSNDISSNIDDSGCHDPQEKPTSSKSTYENPLILVHSHPNAKTAKNFDPNKSKIPKVDNNLLTQINEAIVDYKLSDENFKAPNSKTKKGKIIVHENIIIQPAVPKESTTPKKLSNLLSNLQKFAYKPRPKDPLPDQAEEIQKSLPCTSNLSASSKRVTFFDTPTFIKPQKPKNNLDETYDSITEKISSVSQGNLRAILNEESFELKNYLTQNSDDSKNDSNRNKNIETETNILEMGMNQSESNENQKFETQNETCIPETENLDGNPKKEYSTDKILSKNEFKQKFQQNLDTFSQIFDENSTNVDQFQNGSEKKNKSVTEQNFHTNNELGSEKLEARNKNFDFVAEISQGNTYFRKGTNTSSKIDVSGKIGASRNHFGTGNKNVGSRTGKSQENAYSQWKTDLSSKINGATKVDATENYFGTGNKNIGSCTKISKPNTKFLFGNNVGGKNYESESFGANKKFGTENQFGTKNNFGNEAPNLGSLTEITNRKTNFFVETEFPSKKVPNNFVSNKFDRKLSKEYLSQEKYSYIEEWCNTNIFEEADDSEKAINECCQRTSHKRQSDKFVDRYNLQTKIDMYFPIKKETENSCAPISKDLHLPNILIEKTNHELPPSKVKPVKNDLTISRNVEAFNFESENCFGDAKKYFANKYKWGYKQNLDTLKEKVKNGNENDIMKRGTKRGEPKVVKKGFYNIEIDKSKKPTSNVNFIQTKITDLLKPMPKKNVNEIHNENF